MTKNLVVLESRTGMNSGATLHLLNELRNKVERKLWIPNIPNARVVSEGSSSNPEYAHAECVKLCSSWYEYGEFPILLRGFSFNMGTVVEGFLYFILYPIFRQIDVAQNLIKEMDTVYAESDFTPLGQAVKSVAASMGVDYHVLEPALYRRMKNDIKAYWHHQMRVKSLAPSNLYCVSSKGQRRILFDAPHYSNYFNSLYPVIKELSKISQCYVYGEQDHVGKFTEVVRVARMELLNPYLFSGLQVRPLNRYYSKVKYQSDFQNMFSYKGFSLWDSVYRDLDYIMGEIQTTVINNLFRFARILMQKRPDVLVVSFDQSPSMRGHVLLAKAMGIPTLEVQHGLLTPMSIFAKSVVDMVAAGSENGKKVYVGNGLTEDRIVVTGFPRNDVYQSQEKSGGSRSVLFAMNPVNIKLNLSIIEAMADWLNEKGMTLVVKPHPSEKAKIYQSVLKYKNVELHESTEDIAPLLEQADLVIMEYSTVGIEAVIMNKPMINLSIGHTDISDYVSKGVALDAHTLEDIVPKIQEALDGEVQGKMIEARKEFVYQYSYLPDGKASERVAQLIMKMAEKK